MQILLFICYNHRNDSIETLTSLIVVIFDLIVSNKTSVETNKK